MIKELTYNNIYLIIFMIFFYLLNIDLTFYNYLIYSNIIISLLKITLIKMIDIFTPKNDKIIILPKNVNQYFVITSIINSIFFTITKFYLINNVQLNILNYIFQFIIIFPIVFVFELIYDFIFYTIHYTLHKNNFLYRNIHKIHHKYHDISPYMAFYMHPLESLLSIEIPTIITIFLINKIYNLNFFICVYIYFFRILLEIYGHIGESYNFEIKFNLFSYLGIYYYLISKLKINIVPNDHLLHHKIIYTNYSKRFVLYDKIFGTYSNYDNKILNKKNI